ncbi:DivIVA domain-containing protein [Oscillospiraceae bacterium 38-13]
MLTPQEISARSFTKMVMGGYNMTQVDEFLDELTDDYTSLYKENTSLKAKLKVLVEKVEEYRATEESMRATLLTAQRMADSLVKEAEARRDDILRQAEAAAREKLDGFRREAEDSDKRLRRGQEELQRFIAESRALCVRQMEFLEKLPALELGQEVPAAEIEETVLAAGAETPPPAPEAAPTPEKPAAPPEAAAPTAEELLGALEAAETSAEDLSATRRVNINDLKFGPNYRSDAD